MRRGRGGPGPTLQSLCPLHFSFPIQSSTTDRFTYRSFWKALRSGRPRPEREGMGQKGLFFFSWAFNKCLFEMLKTRSSFVSNHRNTCVCVYICTYIYIHACKLQILVPEVFFKNHNFDFPPKAENEFVSLGNRGSRHLSGFRALLRKWLRSVKSEPLRHAGADAE